ncbi:MAG: response regulator [Anaerolineae bacterium]
MGNAKILIAEDESIVALDIKKRLERLGFTVAAVATSGEEAVRRAAETRPDLVLIDIRLKGAMDGIEAAEAIRARVRVPILYLTAMSDAKTRRRAELTQNCGYLTKPIDGQQLQTTVETALDGWPDTKRQEETGT